MYSSFAGHWRACVFDSSLRPAYWSFQLSYNGLQVTYLDQQGAQVCQDKGSNEGCIPELHAIAEAWMQRMPSLFAYSARHRPGYCLGKYLSRSLVYKSCGSQAASCLWLSWFCKVFFRPLNIRFVVIHQKKNKREPVVSELEGDLLSVVPGVVMMSPSHAAQFQLFKISWDRLSMHSFVSLQGWFT